MNKYIRLFNTVKYLKPIQIYYRIFYAFRRKWRNITCFQYQINVIPQPVPLQMQPSISGFVSYKKNIFTFLNIEHHFKENIDWNYFEYGKLWTYNLTYFDFLQQVNLNKNDGLALIHDFIEQIESIKDGLEPFPIALRGINWIKFLTQKKIVTHQINNSLFFQYQVLMDNLEYHLLGNHLLENGFSLLFGAYYFQNEKFYKKAKEILVTELNEQILDDGAHFELSPMYHQIMLFRLLDCINLLNKNHWKDDGLLELFRIKAKLMLSWLDTITFRNGNIPLFNDCANKIAPTTNQLNSYASTLNIQVENGNYHLSDSGYRKFVKEKYECIVDIGNIGPDYIPGHAHSDTFNFELYVDSKPLIVDSGSSTYEVNSKRIKERSTAAHNTVEVDGLDQSEVWGGFRVANRAKIISIKEKQNFLSATHDGYKKRLGVLHQRQFIYSDDCIYIIDSIQSQKDHDAIFRLHFFPNTNLKIVNNGVFADNVLISIPEHQKFSIKEYQYSPEFNKQLSANMIEISFSKKLEIKIIL